MFCAYSATVGSTNRSKSAYFTLIVYVEEALAEDEQIVFRAGTHTDTMSVRYADFERLVEPTVAEYAQNN